MQSTGAPEGLADHAPDVVPDVLLLIQTLWYVMDEERIGLWLRQT